MANKYTKKLKNITFYTYHIYSIKIGNNHSIDTQSDMAYVISKDEDVRKYCHRNLHILQCARFLSNEIEQGYIPDRIPEPKMTMSFIDPTCPTPFPTTDADFQPSVRNLDVASPHQELNYDVIQQPYIEKRILCVLGDNIIKTIYSVAQIINNY